MVANNIVDGNAYWKGDASIDLLSVDLFGEQLGGLRRDDGVAKLAQVNHLGTGQALRDDPLQGQIDNLGGLLVFGTDVAVREGKIDEEG